MKMKIIDGIGFIIVLGIIVAIWNSHASRPAFDVKSMTIQEIMPHSLGSGV